MKLLNRKRYISWLNLTLLWLNQSHRLFLRFTAFYSLITIPYLLALFLLLLKFRANKTNVFLEFILAIFHGLQPLNHHKLPSVSAWAISICKKDCFEMWKGVKMGRIGIFFNWSVLLIFWPVNRPSNSTWNQDWRNFSELCRTIFYPCELWNSILTSCEM